MTALTTYIVGANSTSQAHAELMVASSGASGGAAGLQPMGTATGWGEIGLGNSVSWASAGAIGAPSGYGALYDGGLTTLTGQTMASGSWSATINLSLSMAGAIGCSLTLRIYKYNTSTTTYTAIGSMMLTSQTVNSTSAVAYNFSGSLPSMAFAANETLYCDLWSNVTSNTMTSGGQWGYWYANSTTLGWIGARIVSPGFSTVTLLVASSSTLNLSTDTLKVALATTLSETTLVLDAPKTQVNATMASVTPNYASIVVVSVLQASASTLNLSTDTLKVALATTLSETTPTSELVNALTRIATVTLNPSTDTLTTVLIASMSSSDPNAQMLNDDLLLQYTVLRMATLHTPIARIFIVRYPPARVLSAHAIPGELDVLLQGETMDQVHQLRSINDVNNFIATYS
jgi:hypothetical protein